MNPEFKKALLEAIRPYEQRITALEEQNLDKEREILTLKLAIASLHSALQASAIKVPLSEKKPKLEERREDRREERKEASKRVVSPRPSSAAKKKPTSSPDDSSEFQFGRKVLTLYPPSRPTTGSQDPPPFELSLSRVQGYNGRTARHNVWFVDDSYAVFSAGCVCVVYNMDTHLQTFFAEHCQEVVALAICRERRLVASGETKSALIYIWGVDDKSVKYRLQFHEKSIIGLNFNFTGNSLISVGADTGHTVAVWTLAGSSARPNFTGQAEKSGVLGVQCNEFREGSVEFVTFGERHLKVWEEKETELVGVKVNFGTIEAPRTILCATFIYVGGVLVGGDNGYVYVVSEGSAKQKVKAHEGAVGVLRSFLDENNDQYIVSCGFDGNIALWNDEIQLVSTLPFMGPEVISMISSGISQKPRAMDVQNTGVILIGTSSGTVIKTSLSGGGSPLVAGHSAEVEGIAVHPSLEEIVTVGEDKTLRIWDGAMIRIQQVVPMSQKLKKCEFSADGSVLALGLTDGSVRLLDWPSLSQLHDLKALSSFPISVLKYSPDGRFLAAGCKDRVYLWKAEEEYKTPLVLQGCSGLVTHATFARNGQYLMCNTSEGELVAWDMAGKRVLKLNTLRDEVWCDWSLIYGWQVSGAWTAGDVECASASPNSSTLAIGEPSGLLRLYQYPAIGSKAGWKEAHAHVSPVQDIKWAGDTTIISAGGADQMLALWTCVL